MKPGLEERLARSLRRGGLYNLGGRVESAIPVRTRPRAELLPTGASDAVGDTIVIGSAAVVPPDNIDDLIGWWRAEDLALNPGDLVSTWPNKVAGGPDWTQTGAARPTYGRFGINYRGCIRFNGSSQWMTISSWSHSASDYTIVGVAVPKATGNTQYLFDNEGGDRLVIAAAGSGTDKVAFFDGSWHHSDESKVGSRSRSVFEWFLDNAGPEIVIDGALHDITSGTVAYSQRAFGGAKGLCSDYAGTGGFFACHLAELVIYDRALTDDERYGLYTYFRDLYAF